MLVVIVGFYTFEKMFENEKFESKKFENKKFENEKFENNKFENKRFEDNKFENKKFEDYGLRIIDRVFAVLRRIDCHPSILGLARHCIKLALRRAHSLGTNPPCQCQSPSRVYPH